MTLSVDMDASFNTVNKSVLALYYFAEKNCSILGSRELGIADGSLQ